MTIDPKVSNAGKPIGVNQQIKINANYPSLELAKIDITDIKTHIDAENFEDAKAQAIQIVRNTLTKRVNYWQAMLDGYNKWTEETVDA